MTRARMRKTARMAFSIRQDEVVRLRNREEGQRKLRAIQDGADAKNPVFRRVLVRLIPYLQKAQDKYEDYFHFQNLLKALDETPVKEAVS